ncbi:MAG: hypothetical protein DWQ34_22160 [Planctomycetota bacterium]|nr:MAG: hypothetical protein DWQ34_22160 [Planctomycetota bacterium]REJ90848.1 MAG: hypothetical protein DWQ29_06270 [Planctomycetota bacterium]REK22122.1 MAG: hypothetical protein DWQ41_19750 [Planctomycetota bacterium]REK34934.1 MAG: hypothetical protein DWQ45_12585 [Planctomycetota bacterium]
MRNRRFVKLVTLAVPIACIGCIAGAAYLRSGNEERLALAARSLQQREPAQARAALERLLWWEPDHPEALHLEGLSYAQEGDWPAAISSLSQVAADSPAHQDAQINLAAALLKDHQLQRAEAVLKSHLLKYPHSWVARRQWSGLLLATLRRREAVAVLEEALELAQPFQTRAGSDAFEKTLEILRDLAVAEVEPPPAAQCLPVLQEALQRDPDQPTVRLALAQCYGSAGQVRTAEQLFREAADEHREVPYVRIVVSRFFVDQMDIPSASEVLFDDETSGSRLHPTMAAQLEEDDRYWEIRCRIREIAGDYEQSLGFIDRALSIRPAETSYLSRRARLLLRLERIPEAQRAFARSHELARAELDLWDLQRNLTMPRPTPAECRRMAELYDALGRSMTAGAWRWMAEAVSDQPAVGPNT